MAFKDLFRPKWKHSDWKVRRNAVEKLTDQALLTHFAMNDGDIDVRSAAVQNPNLTDPALLTHVAKNDSSRLVRAAAVEKLTNQALIAHIAKSDSDEWVRLAAVKNPNLTDQAVLADIAKYDKEWVVCHVAVEKLIDQVILADSAKTATAYDSEKREAAVKKLTDQVLLLMIACNKFGKIYLRLIALKKLDDKSFDQYVYKNIILQDDTDISLRKAAVEKLTDQALLADIVKNHESGLDLHETAVKNPNLTDQAVLAEFAGNKNNNDHIRLIALNKLSDKFFTQTILADIAKNGYFHDRLEAIENPILTDQKVLADMAMCDEDSYIRAKAIEKITDQLLLIGIVKNANDRDWRKETSQQRIGGRMDNGYWSDRLARLTAVDRLTDQVLLEEMYKNENDSYFRASVVAKLDDQALLKMIADTDKDMVVREAAKEKLYGPETSIQRICDEIRRMHEG